MLDVVLVTPVAGVEVVAVFQQDGAAAGPGAHVVRREFHLGAGQVIFVLGGDDEVDALFLRLVNAAGEFPRQPGHDGFSLVVVALVDVVPQDGLFLILGKHGAQALGEVAHLGFHVVPLALFGAGGLAVRAFFPVAHGAFVTADVDVAEGENLLEGVIGVLEEFLGARFLWADQLGGNASVRP